MPTCLPCFLVPQSSIPGSRIVCVLACDEASYNQTKIVSLLLSVSVINRDVQNMLSNLSLSMSYYSKVITSIFHSLSKTITTFSLSRNSTSSKAIRISPARLYLSNNSAGVVVSSTLRMLYKPVLLMIFEICKAQQRLKSMENHAIKYLGLTVAHSTY